MTREEISNTVIGIIKGIAVLSDYSIVSENSDYDNDLFFDDFDIFDYEAELIDAFPDVDFFKFDRDYTEGHTPKEVIDYIFNSQNEKN